MRELSSTTRAEGRGLSGLTYCGWVLGSWSLCSRYIFNWYFVCFV